MRVKMKNDLITIIVPIYNTEKYLERCLDSIINQSYKNIEILLINDGSTDNCDNICKNYQKLDKRIVYQYKENGGLSSVRNLGLKISKGKYVIFIDSDDTIEQEMIEIMYGCIKDNKAEICCCGRTNIFDDGQRKELFNKYCVYNSKEALASLLVYDNMDSSVCDKLILKSLYDGLEFPSGYIAEDVMVTYKLLSRANKVVNCGQCFYNYYQYSGSMSRSKFSKKTMGIYYYHKEVYEYVIDNHPSLEQEAEYFYFSRLIYLYMLCLKSKYYGEEFKIIKQEISKAKRKINKNKFITTKEKLIVFLKSFGMSWAIKLLLLIKK